MAVDCLFLNTKNIDLFLVFRGQLYAFWKESSSCTKGKVAQKGQVEVLGTKHEERSISCLPVLQHLLLGDD